MKSDSKGNTTYLDNMKTLFVVDCSGSILLNNFFFSKLKELKKKYYKGERGDIFFIWNENYYYKNESEIDEFIENKMGFGGSNISLITEIGKETKNEKFEHLIIFTDGSVDASEIDICDRKVVEYNLKYSFVSTYIIGNGGNRAVGVPFSRNYPSATYFIDNNGNEEKLATLSQKEINILSEYSLNKMLE